MPSWSAFRSTLEERKDWLILIYRYNLEASLFYCLNDSRDIEKLPFHGEDFVRMAGIHLPMRDTRDFVYEPARRAHTVRAVDTRFELTSIRMFAQVVPFRIFCHSCMF